jgi:hypothetical protein
VTPLRTRIIRAGVMALLVLALTANVAAAEDAGSTYFLDCVPYDPGLPSAEGAPYTSSWSLGE